MCLPFQIQDTNEFLEIEPLCQLEAFLGVNTPGPQQSSPPVTPGSEYPGAPAIKPSRHRAGPAVSRLKCNLGLYLLQAQTLFDALEWKKVPSLHVAMSSVPIVSLTM